LTRYSAGEQRGVLLVLAHGAGAGQRHPFMVRMAQGLAARGIDVVTFDFPYMHERRKVPDKAPVLEACFRDVVAKARAGAFESHRLFIGGKSMGGRIATHLASQRLDGLAGVVALGYPLHPPGKPEQLRASHLPAIAVPLLVVQGERDTFGTPQELASPLQSVAGPVTLHVVVGGDHSLAVRGSNAAATFEEVVTLTADWMLAVGTSPGHV
jgi:predicted alpha/beta-hydrolase family hydrolase